MGRRIIPFSRLSVVFILAMILSGGTLTYFSINNISNQKELAEKRILEEQSKLSVRFLQALESQLGKVAAGKKSANQEDALKASLIRAEEDYDFIIQAFILGGNGEFVFPRFRGILGNELKPDRSDHFTEAFEQGEKAEFAERDLVKARGYYRSCLNYSASGGDSATALNALGRIAIKSGRIQEVTALFNSILLNHASLTDRNGFPFAYYALSHLLTITAADNMKAILPVVASTLERMANGSIPLNYYSGELLGQISEWLWNHDASDSSKISILENQVSELVGKVRFVEGYGEEISDIFMEKEWGSRYTVGNGFEIIPSASGTDIEIFLIRRDSQLSSGFLIDAQLLFAFISESGIREGLSFEYLLEFPSGYIPNSATTSLVHTSQLSPFFPDQILRIKLQDEDLITDLIKRRRWIYGIASVLLLLAMFLGVVLILRDIAREKRLAALRSDFVSNVTHELKTPLTSIRMYAESLMMKRVKSESGRMKYLSVVVNESERLSRMINNILEFSKMEKSRQEYHPVESNLSEILRTAISDMNYWLEKEGFNMITEIDDDIKVKVDPERFYQVYSNLLSNAIKYSGDSRKIYVRLYKNSGSVITEIEDEGIGIEKDTQNRIFEAFYRVANHGAGNITGTGLGLTVVKEIVEAHQGKIELESEIGKGSKFSVILFQKQ